MTGARISPSPDLNATGRLGHGSTSQSDGLKKKIDFVVRWVDGSDPKWLQEKGMYAPSKSTDAGAVRYRDWDNLEYWFRGVEKFAPWVNRVFLVTWGHVPKWLNREHPKLVIVNHEDFIPADYLPTFNSATIDLNLHRISDLSETFVCFDDDIFIIDQTSPTHFFLAGMPCDIASYSPLLPDGQVITQMIFNDIAMINKSHRKNLASVFRVDNVIHMTARQLLASVLMAPFGLIGAYDNPHLPMSFKRSLFNEVWEEAAEVLDRTCRHRFRHPDGVSVWLLRYWYLTKGEFSPRSRRFGKYFEIRDDNVRMIRCIRQQEAKVICCNDTVKIRDFERTKSELNGALRSLLPEASSFEI